MLEASAYFKSEIAVQNRSSQIVTMLALSHPAIETQRFASDVKPITVQGQEYRAFPFSFQFPGEGDTLPEAQLLIQNVTKEIGEAIRSVKGELFCMLGAVLREEPDQFIADYPRLVLRNASANNAFVTGTLAARSNSNSAWPGVSASPSRCPGLHL